MYSHHILCTTEYISTGSQPTRGQLTGKINVSLSLLAPESWSRETGLAVLSRVSLIIIYTQAESGAYYTRIRVNPEFIGPRNCVPMAFIAESPPAQGP